MFVSRMILWLGFASFALAAAPALSQSGPGSDDLRAAALDFADRIAQADAVGLDPLLAADFVEIGPRGGVTGRADFLSDIRASGQFRPGPELRREWSGITVSVNGDRGLFVGRSTWRRSDPASAQRPNQSVLMTQHWRLQEGRWQVTSLQLARLSPPPDIVPFPSGDLQLRGMLFRPHGPGPFPTIVYAHGNEPDPSDLFERVAPQLVARGYAVWAPHRRGSGLSADQAPNLLRTLTEIERREGVAARSRAALAALEGPHLDDLAAAIAHARTLPFVDGRRLFMIGNSFGGVLTILAAERGLGLAGAAAFAPGALNWERSEAFRTRLSEAARGARIPLFVGQAENDFSTAPARELGAVLAAAGRPHRALIFPPFGVTRREGHGLGVDGVNLWAGEVLPFLEGRTP